MTEQSVKQVTLSFETDGVAKLSGDLCFTTVSQILPEGRRGINEKSVSVFDLSRINQCDSAALSLLLEWKRIANNAQNKIRYVNIPAQLMALAKLSGVEQIISESVDG